VLDDTSLPRKAAIRGRARQYCGALGKIANCQSIVTWHWSASGLHWPLAAQLYLPAVWTEDAVRMTKAGVPPRRSTSEKWRIALDLLDEMKRSCRPIRPSCSTLVTVSCCLCSRSWRSEASLRGSSAGQCRAWPADAVATMVRPQLAARVSMRLSGSGCAPALDGRLAGAVTPKTALWTNVQLLRPMAPMSGSRGAGARLPTWQSLRQPGVTRWLLIEQLGDQTFKYYLSNLPANTPLAELVRVPISDGRSNRAISN